MEFLQFTVIASWIYLPSYNFVESVETDFNYTKINSLRKPEDMNNSAEEPILDLDSMSMLDVCNMISIPEINCTCQNEIISEVLCDNGKLVIGKGPQTVVKDIILTCHNRNVVIAICNTASALIGLLGNILVIFLKSRNCSKSPEFSKPLIWLALSDSIFSIFLLLNNTQKFWTCKWMLGLFMCKLVRTILTATSLIALGFIVIIAIDRYVGIVHSFSQWMTKWKIRLMIAVNIIFALVSVVPIFIVHDIGASGVCLEKWETGSTGSIIYTWFMFLFYFLMPVFVVLILHTIIVRYLKRSIEEDVFLTDGQKRKRFKTNKRIMKILFVVVVFFVLLVLPNRVYWLATDLIDFANLTQNSITILEMVSNIPYGIHVTVNPFIYSFVDANFRHEVFLLFRFNRKLRANSEATFGSNLDSNNSKLISEELTYSNMKMNTDRETVL